MLWRRGGCEGVTGFRAGSPELGAWSMGTERKEIARWAILVRRQTVGREQGARSSEQGAGSQEHGEMGNVRVKSQIAHRK